MWLQLTSSCCFIQFTSKTKPEEGKRNEESLTIHKLLFKRYVLCVSPPYPMWKRLLKERKLYFPELKWTTTDTWMPESIILADASAGRKSLVV